jgi:hypothetical protein
MVTLGEVVDGSNLSRVKLGHLITNVCHFSLISMASLVDKAESRSELHPISHIRHISQTR